MAEAATSMTWTGLVRAVGRWFKENLPRALIMSAISFGFAWLVNFIVMAFRWDGFRAPTRGGSDYIAAQDSLFTGSLFWLGIMSLLFALGSYGYRVGWKQLIEELASLPSSIRQMFQGDERNRSLTTLAWAGMLSMLLGLVISPAVAGIAAGFFVVFAATPLGGLLMGAVRRLWMQLVVRFAPHKGEPAHEVGAAAVTAAGMVAGFVVAAALDSLILGLLAVVMAGLAAYYFANEDELGPGTGTAVFLLVAAGVGLYELFEAGVGIAFADDGGWSECGDCNIIDYVTSTGATEVVSRSVVAGGAAGVGAPIGAAVGDVLGTIGGGTGGGGTGGGGTPTGDGPAGTTEDAPQPDAAGDDDGILGAIGGGEGGTHAPTSDAGTAAPAGEGGTEAATPGPGAAEAPAPRARGGDRGVDQGEAPPPAGGPEDGAATGSDADTGGDSDADAILGAIGGGEGGAAAGSDGITGPDTAAGDDPHADGGAGTRGPSAGAADASTTRRGNTAPQDLPADEPPGAPPPDEPPSDEPPPAAPPPRPERP